VSLVGARRGIGPGSPYSDDPAWSLDDVSTVVLHTVAGVLTGGRLGYALFYKPVYCLTHLLDIVKIWDGGMSFHGDHHAVVVRGGYKRQFLRSFRRAPEQRKVPAAA
jgi:prolipoprotein diacylglyceryltransferase